MDFAFDLRFGNVHPNHLCESSADEMSTMWPPKVSSREGVRILVFGACKHKPTREQQCTNSSTVPDRSARLRWSCASERRHGGCVAAEGNSNKTIHSTQNFQDARRDSVAIRPKFQTEFPTCAATRPVQGRLPPPNPPQAMNERVSE